MPVAQFEAALLIWFLLTPSAVKVQMPPLPGIISTVLLWALRCQLSSQVLNDSIFALELQHGCAIQGGNVAYQCCALITQ